ncbi:TetR/AcrR family transcriptional regulator [Nocardioides nitrophenolicus]|uniref:TetR/AcrR family transcriptional regulator n=1 Tax=Nocardioides nitrophenolicus TaxID=60489 RepID=UPI00195E4C9C|nr:TetR/AcrR family transcriptional regulator [Nocardioides nitrophenolicus]MBM7516654.1 AcrR family transcriptional regulator [Nocardioides nitrophenolicus]
MTLLPTRQALIDAAVDVFTEKGLHGARVIDVTKRAGVAAGSFYTYFETKEGLFLEVVDKVRQELAAEVPRARFSDAESARAWLHDVVRLQVVRLSEGAATWRMINAAALGNVQVATALREQDDPLTRTLTDELGFWAEQGWIDPGVESAVVVDALIALTEQAVQQWSHDDAGPDLEAATAAVADAWTALLRMPPRGSGR